MRSTSSSSSTGTAAAADAGASPREEELRAALGSDEVLPNNVTLLMTRRQRGEDSEGEQEDGEEEEELEDVELDEEAGPAPMPDATASTSPSGGPAGSGGRTIAPLIHQVLEMPLMWRVSRLCCMPLICLAAASLLSSTPLTHTLVPRLPCSPRHPRTPKGRRKQRRRKAAAAGAAALAAAWPQTKRKRKGPPRRR